MKNIMPEGKPRTPGVDPPSASTPTRQGKQTPQTGGGPSWTSLSECLKKKTPHTGGGPLELGLKAWKPRQTPHTGVDRGLPIQRGSIDCKPRTRGDGPILSALDYRGGPKTPRTRGWPLLCGACNSVKSANPAPAGVDLDWARLNGHVVGKPRTSGGGPRSTPPHSGQAPQTPHTGGGPTRSSRMQLGQERKPRTRGGGPDWLGRLPWLQSQTPHPRGWTVSPANPPAGPSANPAPAGVDQKIEAGVD